MVDVVAGQSSVIASKPLGNTVGAARVRRAARPLVARLTLRAKIVGLVCMICALGAAAFAFIVYERASDVAFQKSVEALSGETRLVSVRLNDAYARLYESAAMLSWTRAAPGSFEQLAADGDDPVFDRSVDEWRGQLAQNIIWSMQLQPFIRRVRLVSAESSADILVEVNRADDGRYSVTPQADLQNVSAPEMRAIGAEIPQNGLRVTNARLTRIPAQAEDQMSLVSMIVPVFSAQGERLGMMAVDADVTEFVSTYVAEMRPTFPVTVLNDDGDYLTFAPDGSLVSAGHHRGEGFTPHVFADKSRGLDVDGALLETPDKIFFGMRAPILNSESGKHLTIIMQEQSAAVIALAASARREVLMISVAIVAVSMLLALLLAGLLVRPLEKMTRGVTQYQNGLSRLDLPLTGRDEIGALARAFDGLIHSLNESRERHRLAIEGSSAGLWDWNAATDEVFWSPRLCEIMGVGPEAKASSEAFWSRVHPDDVTRERNARLRHIMQRAPYDVEVRLRREDGKYAWVHMRGQAVWDESGAVQRMAGSVDDITERREMDRIKDEFISTVNHEIRTPLTSIHGSLGLLSRHVSEDLDAKGKRLIELAYTGSERLTRLVNDILDQEQISAGRMKYKLEPTDIGELVTEVVGQHADLAETFGVRFVLEVETNGEHVAIDGPRFSQALANLLSNAAKYSPSEGEVRIRVAHEDADSVRITVADDGLGIPEAFQTRVFQSFARADGSTTRRAEGSGLGLTITKAMIEAFGGSIDFKSIEGVGTTFFVVLPTCADHKGDAKPCLVS